ncbi:predicted protein [Chaetoceros tenuissimus]|uniref:AP2/ERF domain-containing protein n=1 Tax=Chaetoceros tenuissimus TaxID=426638 RepID=A0AAD3CY02_9STRA|nr:predicted protein [Chaetoceros tenuissimus]
MLHFLANAFNSILPSTKSAHEDSEANEPHNTSLGVILPPLPPPPNATTNQHNKFAVTGALVTTTNAATTTDTRVSPTTVTATTTLGTSSLQQNRNSDNMVTNRHFPPYPSQEQVLPQSPLPSRSLAMTSSSLQQYSDILNQERESPYSDILRQVRERKKPSVTKKQATIAKHDKPSTLSSTKKQARTPKRNKKYSDYVGVSCHNPGPTQSVLNAPTVSTPGPTQSVLNAPTVSTPGPTQSVLNAPTVSTPGPTQSVLNAPTVSTPGPISTREYQIVPDKDVCTTYVGVSYTKKTMKYKAYIKQNAKQYHLGCFQLECDAARAYDQAVKIVMSTASTSYNRKKNFDSDEEYNAARKREIDEIVKKNMDIYKREGKNFDEKMFKETLVTTFDLENRKKDRIFTKFNMHMQQNNMYWPPPPHMHHPYHGYPMGMYGYAPPNSVPTQPVHNVPPVSAQGPTQPVHNAPPVSAQGPTQPVLNAPPVSVQGPTQPVLNAPPVSAPHSTSTREYQIVPESYAEISSHSTSSREYPNEDHLPYAETRSHTSTLVRAVTITPSNIPDKDVWSIKELTKLGEAIQRTKSNKTTPTQKFREMTSIVGTRSYKEVKECYKEVRDLGGGIDGYIVHVHGREGLANGIRKDEMGEHDVIYAQGVSIMKSHHEGLVKLRSYIQSRLQTELLHEDIAVQVVFLVLGYGGKFYEKVQKQGDRISCSTGGQRPALRDMLDNYTQNPNDQEAQDTIEQNMYPVLLTQFVDNQNRPADQVGDLCHCCLESPDRMEKENDDTGKPCVKAFLAMNQDTREMDHLAHCHEELPELVPQNDARGTVDLFASNIAIDNSHNSSWWLRSVVECANAGLDHAEGREYIEELEGAEIYLHLIEHCQQTQNMTWPPAAPGFENLQHYRLSQEPIVATCVLKLVIGGVTGIFHPNTTIDIVRIDGDPYNIRIREAGQVQRRTPIGRPRPFRRPGV